MKNRDESPEQHESTNALQVLEIAFGDGGLRRNESAIGDLLHFVDEKHGPKIALLWQIRLLGFGHLISVAQAKKHVRIRSRAKFERRFGVRFDLTFAPEELFDVPLYD